MLLVPRMNSKQSTVQIFSNNVPRPECQVEFTFARHPFVCCRNNTNLTKLFITYFSNMLFITRNDSLTHRSLVLFSNKFPFQNCRVTCFLFFFFIFSPELGFHYVKGLHIFSSHSIQDTNAKVIIKGQFSRKSYLTIALVLN